MPKEVETSKKDDSDKNNEDKASKLKDMSSGDNENVKILSSEAKTSQKIVAQIKIGNNEETKSFVNTETDVSPNIIATSGSDKIVNANSKAQTKAKSTDITTIIEEAGRSVDVRVEAKPKMKPIGIEPNNDVVETFKDFKIKDTRKTVSTSSNNDNGTPTNFKYHPSKSISKDTIHGGHETPISKIESTPSNSTVKASTDITVASNGVDDTTKNTTKDSQQETVKSIASTSNNVDVETPKVTETNSSTNKTENENPKTIEIEESAKTATKSCVDSSDDQKKTLRHPKPTKKPKTISSGSIINVEASGVEVRYKASTSSSPSIDPGFISLINTPTRFAVRTKDWQQKLDFDDPTWTQVRYRSKALREETGFKKVRKQRAKLTETQRAIKYMLKNCDQPMKSTKKPKVPSNVFRIESDARVAFEYVVQDREAIEKPKDVEETTQNAKEADTTNTPKELKKLYLRDLLADNVNTSQREIREETNNANANPGTATPNINVTLTNTEQRTAKIVEKKRETVIVAVVPKSITIKPDATDKNVENINIAKTIPDTLEGREEKVKEKFENIASYFHSFNPENSPVFKTPNEDLTEVVPPKDKNNSTDIVPTEKAQNIESAKYFLELPDEKFKLNQDKLEKEKLTNKKESSPKDTEVSNGGKATNNPRNVDNAQPEHSPSYKVAPIRNHTN